MTATILFYETDKPYGCFSNFSRHSIVIDKTTWLTSEHYFQAAKFTDPADIEAVRSASTPFLAAQLGRERGRSFRTDWDAVRDDVMRLVLRTKFTQHAELQAVLLSTSGAMLIEHTRNDRYWADGGDGAGLNRLGKLLEELRTALLSDRADAPQAAWCEPPWVARPDVEPSDLFWRMGQGEQLLANAARFRAGLAPAARLQYDSYFPSPAAWTRSW